MLRRSIQPMRSPRSEAPAAAGSLRAPQWAAGALLLLLLALPGCYGGEELGRVTGRVTFRGQPVSQGLVVFVHQEKKGISMTAELQPDGTFEVQMAQGFGLPLGKYAVAVSPPLMDHPLGPIAERPAADPFPQIPRKYREPETSPAALEVRSGQNRLVLDMQPD